jgi:Mg2+ and Co2+ transporter CorA
MSGMEPEVKDFLSKISTSLSVGLLWLLINTTIGIGFNFAFFEDKPSIGNYIFYAWFLISLYLLIVFYRKKWKF